MKNLGNFLFGLGTVAIYPLVGFTEAAVVTSFWHRAFWGIVVVGPPITFMVGFFLWVLYCALGALGFEVRRKIRRHRTVMKGRYEH